MNTLKRIKNETSTSFILITHDIAPSSELADRATVMYAGQMVEFSDATFFTKPLHPYSQKLMASVPKLRQVEEPEFISTSHQPARSAHRLPLRRPLHAPAL
ncbi:MAG: hypothetical protein R2856_28760 [Caldilineaceae bacterium]